MVWFFGLLLVLACFPYEGGEKKNAEFGLVTRWTSSLIFHDVDPAIRV